MICLIVTKKSRQAPFVVSKKEYMAAKTLLILLIY
jgi:hypothetical protein